MSIPNTVEEVTDEFINAWITQYNLRTSITTTEVDEEDNFLDDNLNLLDLCFIDQLSEKQFDYTIGNQIYNKFKTMLTTSLTASKAPNK